VAAAERKRVRPFLKWAGNKFAIAERIRSMLPPGARLVEPFVGSAAAFLNTDYPGYLLSDSNDDLIELYRILQREGEPFVRYCARLFTPENNREEAYYALREEFNACRRRRRRAALFLYLNRHGFNGLCRYNSRGGFNVPFGCYQRPYFPEREMLHFYHRARHAEIVQRDFAETLRAAREGDVVYCDPPYVPLSLTANFTAYHRDGFDLALQERLADLARETAARGIPVLVSNHATPLTRELYAGAELHEIQVRRTISRDGTNRGLADEILALFRPPA